MPVRILILWRPCIAAVSLAASGAALPQELDPFRAPNLSPPVAIAGLPLWADVPESTTLGFTTELANHYRFSRRHDERLRLDGETARIRAYVEHPFRDRWAVGVDVPYYRQSGGVLDDVVDGWHSAFGLPDGGREHRPAGLIEFDLADASGSFFSLNESGSGLGDIQISLAGRFGDGPGTVLRAALKLPTGKEALLAGSGDTDWSLSALRLHEGSLGAKRAGFYYGGAVIEFGQPKNILFPAKDRALAAVIGGTVSIRSRFGIKGQIDVNSAFYTSALDEIGANGVQATLGGWLRFGRAGLFEYAVSEDLNVNTAPDVVVFANLSWRLP